MNLIYCICINTWWYLRSRPYYSVSSICKILTTPIDLKYHMAAANSHEANGFSRYIPHQPPGLARENAWVSLQHCNVLLNAHLSMCIPLQVPPAAANNEPENMPPPDRGVAEPARMQDLHHIDMAYQGIVDYHPQPLAVSNFHLSAARPLFD